MEQNQTLTDLQLSRLRPSPSTNQRDTSVGSKWAGFLKPTGYKPFCILLVLFLLQQFSGGYVILVYAVTYLQGVGTNLNPYHSSIIIGVVRFLMCAVNTWLLRRFGRKPLIMISSLCMTSCMLVSGMFTLWIHQGNPVTSNLHRSTFNFPCTGTTTHKWVPVACLALFVCSSMIGLIPIPWTMTAELFPMDIRSNASAICRAIANVYIFSAIHSYRSVS